MSRDLLSREMENQIVIMKRQLKMLIGAIKTLPKSEWTEEIKEAMKEMGHD